MNHTTILQVAIAAPLHRLFDYLPPATETPAELEPGMRLKVPFGRGFRVGVLVGCAERSDIPLAKLKRVQQVLDDSPVINAELMGLLRWASDYYRHPIGEVCHAALPKKIRDGESASGLQERWRLSAAIPDDAHARLNRAPRQRELLEFVQENDGDITTEMLRSLSFNAASSLRALHARGWMEKHTVQSVISVAPSHQEVVPGPVLNPEQQTALDTLTSDAGYACTLLHGITGSGKTEVYFRHIRKVLDAGKSCLVLVPEISLTPQLLGRFETRFSECIAVLHSGLSDRERLHNWRMIREHHARIVIGTRSAIFAPLSEVGLIILDEEHDPSFKQQEGFRYSARDLAIVRARSLNIPVVLGTATPSLESMQNAIDQRYQLLQLTERAGDAVEPDVQLIDLRTEPSHLGLSTRLIARASHHLDNGGQLLFFLNRRGYAPAWYCNQCGWMADCRHCDAHLTYHFKSHSLRCHHCSALEKVPDNCPTCEAELKPVGEGTERVEEQLKALFPDEAVARLDRDVVRKKGDLENFIERVKSGEARILIGTQMLAKGHHFPNVTLVAVLNADQGLFGIDFRSTERLAQTIVQVAGRSGRANKRGEVLIQTSFPEHPLLQSLLTSGYEAFAHAALEERKASRWPPFSHLAMVRASSKTRQKTMGFLQQTRASIEALCESHNVELLGPVLAPMARRAGREHGQLLLQSTDRKPLIHVLRSVCHHLDNHPPESGVRWSLDVDPLELF